MKRDPSEVKYLTVNEVTSLVDCLYRHDKPRDIVLVLLMLDAGLRSVEVRNLRWGCIDFAEKIINFPSAKKDHISYRHIPLSPRLFDALINWRKLHPPKNKNYFLFTSKNASGGVRNLSPSTLTKTVNQYRLRLNMSKLTPHSLRHTFATFLLSSGSDIGTVKETLGHSSIQTTSIYAKTTPSELRRRFDRASEIQAKGIKRLFLTAKHRISYLKSARNNNTLAPDYIGAKYIFVGRFKQINLINSNLKLNVSTLIIGPKGVGKSELCKIVRNKYTGKVLIWDDLDNIKATLINTIIYLLKNDKEYLKDALYGDYDLEEIKVRITRDSVPALCDYLLKLLEPYEYKLFIDSMDSISKKSELILEKLQKKLVIIGACRSLSVKYLEFTSGYNIIKLSPLNRSESLTLIEHATADLSNNIDNYSLIVSKIYDKSGGNPYIMKLLIERIIKEPIITPEIIEIVSYGQFRKELDLSAILILGLGCISILRYIGRAKQDTVLTFIGGAALIFVYIIRTLLTSGKRKKV